MRELLLGCGTQRQKLISLNGDAGWHDLTTLDIDPDVKPDIVYDLSWGVMSFAEANTYDEIHAYCVLEHCGQQGDWRLFFRQLEEFHRILKPGGLFMGICPKPDSPWAWADPGHTRIIAPETLSFLSQANYGTPPMTDYRPWYRGDFVIEHMSEPTPHQHAFVLRAVK